MSRWTRVQIEVMARGAGWGRQSKNVSYVAMAESSGDDHVVNASGAVGLLQIMQPVHVKDHPQWTKKWLQNPENNLKAGLVLYKAAGYKFDGPWADSKNKGDGGGWGKHIDEKSSGKTDSTSDSSSGGSSNADQTLDVPDLTGLSDFGDLTGLSDIAYLMGYAAGWLSNPQNWIRILYVAAGGTIALSGLLVMSRSSIGSAVRVLPANKVTNIVRKVT